MKRNNQLLTVSDLADYLNCSKGTIYNLKSKGLIPFIDKKGLGIRFDRNEIDNWLNEEDLEKRK